MKEIILIKNGELALKGLNRRTFEDMLIKNMRRRLEPVGKFRFTVAQSTIVAEPEDEQTDLDEAVERIGKVFGIAGFSRAAAVEKDMDVILRSAEEYLAPQLLTARSFKVEAKRSDKKFPLNSPQICAKAGEYLLEKFPHLTVDVHSPDLVVNIEVRDAYAYIHGKQIKGAGGMPTGSAGRAALLISGGIDSPVAGYMMAKRGLELIAVHFASPPYTSERAEQKVHSLLRQVSRYSGRIGLWVVPFTETQELIKDNCPEEIFTVIMRRMMMRTAQIIAKRENAGALITGESVGQVASQTMPAIACTDAVCEMPVFRPLIGMDKDEVIAISRKIDTFDISILPYEDCCTVFTPKHPRTRPTLEYVEECEKALETDRLSRECAENARFVAINAY
ncbi:MAG: tRNA uracil 4-sulfurtransferase ThiI [Oscillospiraceae bacterium]|nr:tRNA uracil 4-sulfurtransferase ThiI [Oscillospiraceae bacterium]